MTLSLVVRDQYGVHPDDQPFVEEKIKQVMQQYGQFHLLEKKLLQQVWVIGTLLHQLKEKVFAHQWQNFCQDHFKVSQRRIQQYMQLAANRPQLEEYFKSELNFASGKMPGINEAIAIVRTWTNKRKKTSSSRTVKLKEYCPTCGRALTKDARDYMKHQKAKANG